MRRFNPAQHCAQCLIGEYVDAFGTKMPDGQVSQVELAEGEFLYLCGVSQPYRWPLNFHLALRPVEDGFAQGKLYTGDALLVTGAEAVPIAPDGAIAAFPGRGKEYLTCRNFQFGARYLLK
ncbi:MAG: hypothetical protein ACREML_14275 [Vulcanimicrobiaceae bacterium]